MRFPIFESTVKWLRKRLMWSVCKDGSKSQGLHGFFVLGTEESDLYVGTDGSRMTLVATNQCDPLEVLHASVSSRHFVHNSVMDLAAYWARVGTFSHIVADYDTDDSRSKASVWHSYGRTELEADFPDFPPFEQVIEGALRPELQAVCVFKVKALKDAVKTMSAHWEAVEIVPCAAGARLVGKMPKDRDNPEAGPAVFTVKGLGPSEEPTRITASCKYLLDVLSSLGSKEEVTVEVRDCLDPIVIKATDLFHILMPMRV